MQARLALVGGLGFCQPAQPKPERPSDAAPHERSEQPPMNGLTSHPTTASHIRSPWPPEGPLTAPDTAAPQDLAGFPTRSRVFPAWLRAGPTRWPIGLTLAWRGRHVSLPTPYSRPTEPSQGSAPPDRDGLNVVGYWSTCPLSRLVNPAAAGRGCSAFLLIRICDEPPDHFET